MNVVREIQRLNERELELHVPDHASWHAQYSHSAYIFVAGLDYQLTEGDVICISSQFGEVVDCNLVRDRDTGKSRGFAFLAYEDQRSSVLAIDNLNGATVVGRTLRVDHADKYRRPKEPIDPSSAAAADADFRQFDAEEAADYDARRKRIWDFDAHAPLRATQGSGGPGAGSGAVRGREGGSAPLSYSVDVKALKVSASSEDANALRILRLWEERQQRKKEREEEERRKELQMQRGGSGRNDGRRFGDQPVQVNEGKAEEERKQPVKEEKTAINDAPRSGDSSGKRGKEEERKESAGHRRRRSDSRERSPRRSRSGSKERSRRRRERPRERDRDRRGHEERSRCREGRSSSEESDRRRHRRRDRDKRSRSR